MELVVHKPFELNGKLRVRGTPLFGSDVDAVMNDRILRAFCGPVPDGTFSKPADAAAPEPVVAVAAAPVLASVSPAKDSKPA